MNSRFFQWWFVYLLLLSPVLHAEEDLRVMSFNIRFGSAKDGDNSWDKRKELVAKTMLDFNPDLLGLQESLDFQTAYIVKKFSGYTAVGTSREKNPKQGEAVPILFRKDRFELLEAGDFWLSETPEKRGSIGWDAACPRIVTWAKLKERNSKAGRVFYFASTHFDHRGVKAREQSAKQLRAKIDSWLGQKVPVIVVGDFNCQPDSVPHKVLVKEGVLVDTFGAIHSDQTKSLSTLTNWNGRREGPRIDWILHTKKFDTIDAAINYSCDDNDRYPSDHYPVQAVLKFR